MAWSQISGTIPQYFKETINGGSGPSAPASGYYMKFYNAVNEAISMASDNLGGGLLDKCELDSSGYPLNGSDGRFIPLIDQAYKIAFFQNADDANNNTFTSSDWFLPSTGTYTPFSTTGASTSNYASLRSITGQSDGEVINVLGAVVEGFGGGQFRFNEDSTETDDGGKFIVPAEGGGAWERVTSDGRFNVLWYGAIGTGVAADYSGGIADDFPGIDATRIAAGAFGNIYSPTGIYILSGTITTVNTGDDAFRRTFSGDGMNNTYWFEVGAGTDGCLNLTSDAVFNGAANL